MKKYYMSSVSHAVMNLVMNIAEAKRLEKHKDHKSYMAHVQAKRWKAIFDGPAFQPMFS